MTLIVDVFLDLLARTYVVREMSKKSRFRGNFDKWHGRRTETLLKSEWQHLYHIYWSLWRILEFKKSLFLIFKVLGLFVNPLTGEHKYSLRKGGSLLQHLQMHLSQKRKIFINFFFHFRNLESLFNILKKKMTLIAHVFLKLRTQKNVVR